MTAAEEAERADAADDGADATASATVVGVDRDRETDRWRGVSAAALLTGGVGIVLGRPVVLLLAVVGVGFAAYARAAVPPPAAVEVERTVSDPEPAPDDEVTVTVTVRNVGDGTLPDLRYVDGVPEATTVTEGSPRIGTSLRSGRAARFSYRLDARRGVHEFGSATVLVRDFSGAIERALSVEVESEVVCIPQLEPLPAVPLRAQTTQYTGRVTTDVGGEGVEFHATREYRPGDALNRIDWNRRARTGRLATLEFREERAATVVVLVDCRDRAYRVPEPGAASALDRSVEAAGRLVATLLDSGDRVGVAGLGPGDCWVAPGASTDHRTRVRRLLATHPTLDPVPGGDRFYPALEMARLRRRLPDDAQVVLLSGLGDQYVAEVARRLDAYGYPVTVVSPDATADRTAGHRLARVERTNRIDDLRQAGLRVVSWDSDEPLEVAVTRADERWSR